MEEKTMAIDMDLAKRLKVYRNFKHLTQKDVATHLHVPHSAISDIENGKRDITVGELKILSHIYGRSVDEIMSGKKYDYYNIANIARLLSELPDEDLKEVMFIIEYKRKRLEEKKK
jgi:Plasmid maintenance system antidote protein